MKNKRKISIIETILYLLAVIVLILFRLGYIGDDTIPNIDTDIPSEPNSCQVVEMTYTIQDEDQIGVCSYGE